MMLRYLNIICLIVVAFTTAAAQEMLVPLHGNMNLIYREPVNNTISSSSDQKIMTSANDTIPYLEDFAYGAVSPYPGKKWADSSVFINAGMAIAPPSIGVATFDGLDKYGYPYNLSAGATLSTPADVLTSKSINLPYKTGGGFYLPSDSIAFSFLYQSAGFGDNPETNDSLVLEFYKPLAPVAVGTTTTYGKWTFAWGTRGVNSPQANDSTFKRAWIRIKDTAYFHDGFKFRFRNRATPSGSLDHWNVDYINIKPFYNKVDTIYNEVAFAYVPRPFLKNYSAMPYKQFLPSEMGTKTSVFIRNNYYDPVTPANSKANVGYGYKIYDKTNALLSTYTLNNCNVDFFNKTGYDNCPAHANPPISYTFAPTDTCTFRVVHTLTTTPDYGLSNDTVVQYQNLSNYYAYDDLSAEAGYSLTINGSKCALRYTLNVTDTLQAMDIFFDPVIQGNLIINSSFRMTIWADGGGQPGGLVYRDSSQLPQYLKYGYNKIPRYKFTSPIVLSPGTYYFGIQQTLAQGLGIGFDRNIDHSDALFFDVGSGWQPSGIKGSLMIHPIFGRPAYVIGINEPKKNEKENQPAIYPNPAKDLLYIHNKAGDPNSTLELYSSLGEKIKDQKISSSLTEIDIAGVAPGLYIVVLKTAAGNVSQQKLIISR